jgi:hypothetical protein
MSQGTFSSRSRNARIGLTAALVLLGTAGTALAQSQFDGVWSLRYETDKPECARPTTWRYALRISGGSISPAGAGDQTTVINGSVDADGNVKATVRRESDRARGTGRLTGSFGSGGWTSPTRNCSGTWTVRRVSPS